MAAFLQTIIGAAAAIAGGLAAVWWQARHAQEVARRIRRDERREEALLALNAKTVEIVERAERDYRPVENAPETWGVAWEAVHGAVEELRRMWEADVSGKIPDAPVVEKYLAVRVQLHECAGRLGLPHRQNVSATSQDFLRDGGRLLMLLGELAKELRSHVDGELLAETKANPKYRRMLPRQG